MIKEKAFATKVLAETFACFERLNNLLIDAQQTLSTKEFNQLRRGVGLVIADMYSEVERPIHKAHPDLEPEALRNR